MTLEGIDVSSFQNGTNWSAVAGAGITFAIAKVSEGNGFEDPAWASNAGPLAAVGPIVAGAYHFARPDFGNAPEAEADWFWQRLTARVPDVRGWLLALDLEVGSGALGDWRDRWCARIRDHAGGYLPGWYTFWDFARTRALNTATDYWSWLAWPDANGPMPAANFSVAMQQYGLRSVPGIGGQVDANRFFGDLDQLKALTVGGNVALDPNDPVIKDIIGRLDDHGARLGALQFATGSPVAEGEVLVRLRQIDQHTGADAPAALAALKTELDAVQAALLGGTSSAVDLSKVYAELDALSKHLGVGTP